jgi:preprotein translocase subunit SecE
VAQTSSTQVENAPNKPVHLIYLCGAVLAFYLLQWTIDWIWGYFGTPPSEFNITLASGVIAVLAAVVMYRNDRIYTYANEVAGELKKVTWPTAKEVRTATIVVIVMAIISAIILGVFDLIFSKLTDMVYGSGV